MKILNKITGTIKKIENDIIYVSFIINNELQLLLNDLNNNLIKFGELEPSDIEYNHISHTIEILNETSDDNFICVDIKLKILNTWYGIQLKKLIENKLEIITTLYHIQDDIQKFNININTNHKIQKIW